MGSEQATRELKTNLKRLTEGDYAGMVGIIADGLRYDPEQNRIWIDPGFTLGPDESFPDDPALHNGPLTMAMWTMRLHDLADALPPWDRKEDE